MTHDPRYPDDIERDLERDRQALRRTLDDLQGAVSLEGLSQRVTGTLRRNGAEWAQSANAAVRANPVALGLTGVGLGWLIFGRGYDPVHRWSDGHTRSPASAFPSPGKGTADRIQDAGTRATEQARHLRDRFTESTEGLGDEARRRVDAARQEALDASDRASQSVAQDFRSEPLLFGALALVGGAALGALLPGTRQEDELLTDYRDRLFDEAEAVFQEEKGKVTSAVSAGMDEARAAAKRVVDAATGDLSQDADADGDATEPRAL
ncbi:MAG: DUF3618 domain-containing protein [Paracoccus sp.]|nr:DUF3618 domain-containing protein [Paracoccus sp. (in: a-proteobacteria)]